MKTAEMTFRKRKQFAQGPGDEIPRRRKLKGGV